MFQPLDNNRLMPQARRGELQLPTLAPATERIAVVLNRNAKMVDDRVANRLARFVPAADFYYSHTLDEAESFARQIVQKGYGTVLCGGGDGTLVNVMNHVYRYIDEANEWRKNRARHFGEQQALLPYPEFGVLKLGTGNGLSKVVGAANAALDLQKVFSGPRHPSIEVDLIEAEGTKFVFAGLGYDAWVLNDYMQLKKWADKHKLMKKFTATAAGYLMAVVGRTVPAMLKQGFYRNVRVINQSETAYFMDGRRGDRAIPIKNGEVLYEGPAGLVGVGTSPYYGFGFKIYPFAGTMPRMMNLRVATMGPVEVLSRLPSLWMGYHRSNTILDFMVEKVKIESDDEFPFQHSGDAMGYRKEMTFSMSSKPLKLVDYRGSII